MSRSRKVTERTEHAAREAVAGAANNKTRKISVNTGKCKVLVAAISGNGEIKTYKIAAITTLRIANLAR